MDISETQNVPSVIITESNGGQVSFSLDSLDTINILGLSFSLQFENLDINNKPYTVTIDPSSPGGGRVGISSENGSPGEIQTSSMFEDPNQVFTVNVSNGGDYTLTLTTTQKGRKVRFDPTLKISSSS